MSIRIRRAEDNLGPSAAVDRLSDKIDTDLSIELGFDRCESWQRVDPTWT